MTERLNWTELNWSFALYQGTLVAWFQSSRGSLLQHNPFPPLWPLPQRFQSRLLHGGNRYKLLSFVKRNRFPSSKATSASLANHWTLIGTASHGLELLLAIGMDLVSKLDPSPNPLPIKHVNQAKQIRDLPWKFFLDDADREETFFPIGQDTAAGNYVFSHVRKENGAQHRRMRQRKRVSNPWLLSFFGEALLLPSWTCDPLIFFIHLK